MIWVVTKTLVVMNSPGRSGSTAAFQKNECRSKPGVHKRTIRAAVAGVAAEGAVPRDWGEAVGNVITIKNISNAKN